MGLGREFDSFLLLSITQSLGGGSPSLHPRLQVGGSIASCYDYEGGRGLSHALFTRYHGETEGADSVNCICIAV